MADGKRSALQRLYRHDDRAASWRGTAYGVIQAVNTFEHHEGIIRGGTRGDRNMLRTVTGDFTKVDQGAWRQLETILMNS